MELVLERAWPKETYTIGNLYINNTWFCHTCEDVDRGLNSSMTLEEIKKIKVYSETAIPKGKYKIAMNTVSPKFNQKQFYRDVCEGKVPRVLNVPGYDGILIHVGTKATQSAGCILVGHNKVKGGLTNSKEVFITLYEVLKRAASKGETIYLTIK
jgi:hypothetical protein